MGPGGPRGLQIRRRRGSAGMGGFDSHTLPPNWVGTDRATSAGSKVESSDRITRERAEVAPPTLLLPCGLIPPDFAPDVLQLANELV
jgi:hypothetical protein